MSAKTHLKDQFESFLQYLVTTPGVVVNESACTDHIGRITWSCAGVEFIQTVQVLHDHRSPAQQAEEEGRPFEAGPMSSEEVEELSQHIASAVGAELPPVDREANPAPTGFAFDEGLDESHRRPVDAHPNTD